jgi:hypothetical protein
MNRCLVTKLKGVVDNNNLVKYGFIRVPFTADTVKQSIFIANQGPWREKFAAGDIDSTTISVDNGAYFTNWNSEESIGNTVTITKSLLPYDLYVPNLTTNITYEKYKTPFIKGDMQLSDIKFVINTYSITHTGVILETEEVLLPDNIVSFSSTKCKGTIVLNAGLKSATLTGCNLSKIVFNNNPTEDLNLDISGRNSNRSTGELSALNSVLNLTGLSVYVSDISGSFNSLFDAWASAGKEGQVRMIFGSDANSPYTTVSGSLAGLKDQGAHFINFENGSWSVVS